MFRTYRVSGSRRNGTKNGQGVVVRPKMLVTQKPFDACAYAARAMRDMRDMRKSSAYSILVAMGAT